MFTYIGILASLLVCSKGQMRPSNWDLDVMRFDQNDWNKFNRDFEGQNRKPFPNFRSHRIPTQQPPIVGEIPGQIGGHGGQKGQSGNDNIPPPLPPMPRIPGVLPTPSQPPPKQPSGPGSGSEKPPDKTGDGGVWKDRQPRPGMGPKPSEPPPQGVEPQNQVPPPLQPSNPEAEGDDMSPSGTEATNQSETPQTASETTQSSGESTTTQTSVSTGQNDDNGFSFGMGMGGYPDQFGQGGSSTSQEQFGFSGENDTFPTFEPPQQNTPGQIDQRDGVPSRGQFPSTLNGAATSEQKNVMVPPPRGKFGQIPRLSKASEHDSPLPAIKLKSVLRQEDISRRHPMGKNVPSTRDLDNGVAFIQPSIPKGTESADRVDGHLIGVVGNGSRSPRG